MLNSYDIKISQKLHFWRKNFTILSLCMQHCNGSLIKVFPISYSDQHFVNANQSFYLKTGRKNTSKL